MISITSTELNYLVFRYLHESGFTHSAFAFGYEAGINKSTFDGNLVPPGALVTFVQKGIQYLELDANLSSTDVDMDDDFSFLQPLDLITKDPYELQKIIKAKKENLQKDRLEENGKHNESNHEIEQENVQEREKEKKGREKEQEQDKEKIEKDREREKGKDKEKPHQDHVDREKCEDKVIMELEENGTAGGPEPMDISTSSTSLPCEIPSSDVKILEGHTSEVFACAWSPSGSLLASGSGDSTARIWTIVDGPSISSVQDGPLNVAVLKHFKGRTNEKSKDVTTLDWNGDGTLLATGSYDGQARIWSKDGELRSTLNKHKGPIFSLKWNKKGDFLLSGSVDKSAIVWDIKTGEWRQQFEFHSAPTLDVDWRNNVSFATCSTDSMIHVCKVGENRPMKTFSGHQVLDRSSIATTGCHQSVKILSNCIGDDHQLGGTGWMPWWKLGKSAELHFLPSLISSPSLLLPFGCQWQLAQVVKVWGRAVAEFEACLAKNMNKEKFARCLLFWIILSFCSGFLSHN